jgi:cell division protein FtsL
MYRIFKRPGAEAPSVRPVVIAMIAIACVLTAVGVIMVQRQHQVLRLGYQLSRESEHVRKLGELRHDLLVERATLTAPDRIRHLATQLGMIPAPPDHIRVIGHREHVTQ